MQHCQTATGCHGGWAPWVAIDKALMQRQGTDTANEKKMLQRIKLTDKEVPEYICIGAARVSTAIYGFPIYGFSAIYKVLLNAWVVKCSHLNTTWPYIYSYASINHVYIWEFFFIWVPENEPLKQPLKQTSETHPLSWLKKLEKKPAVKRNLKAIWAAKGGAL